jgi:TolB-like protein
MAEIFISYARSTATAAQAVAGALRSAGFSVWFDEDLPAHRAFTEVIEERLGAAGAVVVIWSAEAAKSEWVQSEADAARAAHKLVQMTVDGARLPMPFDRIQCADLSGWTGDLDAAGWRKVLASVRDLIGDAATPHRPSRAVGRVEPLLAVLAFDNLSGDAEMAYFSDGVSEEILQTVARGAELKVIGRGSSFQFRGRDKAAAHVAAALNATHVLDGSVRRSGAKVRIAANLIECERETTLWSERFDRELSDVFALQDEIAAVAAALKVAFAPAVQAESVDPAAYTLYLRALEVRNRGLLAPATRAAVIQQLEEVTRLAPKFARAWECLATMKAARFRFGEDEQPQPALRREVAVAAETALKLDPSLGGAHQALGLLQPLARFAEREAFHMRALSVAPNDPTVLTNASLFFTEVGRVNEALGYATQAHDLDPRYPWVANWYANMLDYAGRFAEAGAVYETAGALWPDNELIARDANLSAAAHGDWAWFDALVALVRERKLDTPTLNRAITNGRALREPEPGIRQRALARARSMLAETGDVELFSLTFLYKLGLADEVFDLIERASFAFMFDPERRSPNATASNGVIFSAAHNNPMIRDPRFPRLCDELGLCSYWSETGRWPDCAEAVAPFYDFKAECRRLAAAKGERSRPRGG